MLWKKDSAPLKSAFLDICHYKSKVSQETEEKRAVSPLPRKHQSHSESHFLSARIQSGRNVWQAAAGHSLLALWALWGFPQKRR